MPEVSLQCPGIDAVIGQLEAAGMAQHVRMDGEAETGRLASAGNELLETAHRKGRAALVDKHEWSTARGSLHMKGYPPAFFPDFRR
jgi:hypothetical protein